MSQLQQSNHSVSLTPSEIEAFYSMWSLKSRDLQLSLSHHALQLYPDDQATRERWLYDQIVNRNLRS